MYIKGGGRVVIIGCGGHARSIAGVLLEEFTKSEIFLADQKAGHDEYILGCTILQTYDLCEKDVYIIGVGDNEKRKKSLMYMQNQSPASCISVVSSCSYISEDVNMEEGVFIAARVYLGPQVSIGQNSIVNTGSIIEHETIIGRHSHIAPHATICGRCKIGSHVFCGAGVTVIDKISICDNVKIGAGAVVKENIAEPGTYVGIPARKVRW